LAEGLQHRPATQLARIPPPGSEVAPPLSARFGSASASGQGRSLVRASLVIDTGSIHGGSSPPSLRRTIASKSVLIQQNSQISDPPMSKSFAGDELPMAIAVLVPEDRDRWLANMPGGKTRRQITEKAIINAAGQRSQSGHDKLRELIDEEFGSASPDRAEQLHDLLTRAFTGRLDPAHAAALQHWRKSVRDDLQRWRSDEAFQPAPYRKLLVAAWTAAISVTRDQTELNDCNDFIANAVAHNFREAINTGQVYAREHGADARASHGKVRNGLARHITATLDAASDFNQESRTAYRLAIAALCASSISGLLEAVGNSKFFDDYGEPVTPYDVMSAARESWAEVQAVLHLLSFSQRPLPTFVVEWLTSNTLEQNMIGGFWLASARLNGQKNLPTICPIPSRACVVDNRIDFPIEVIQQDNSRETVGVALFLKPVRASRAIRELLDECGLVIGRQILAVGDTRVDSTLLTQVPIFPDEQVPPSAQRVADIIEVSVAKAIANRADAAVIELRNFPSDFPLEKNSGLSDMYLVSRPSVEAIVHDMIRKPGLYLCCGMRRGGKTTAFHPTVLKRMLIAPDAARIETSRRQTLDCEFFPWLQAQFDSGGILSTNALDEWFGVNLENRRLFVLDEFEHLFGWLQDIVRERPTARARFVDPLLDGFLRASDRWSFLFLGFNPGAARIFMADNPLTPRLQVKSFPYFHHEKGSRTSEFAKLVQVVLTHHLEIDSELLTEFARASGGHPHFTVSLLCEFVDWMIDRQLLTEKRLPIRVWPRFRSDRLAPLVMRQSKWFTNYAGIHQGLRNDDSMWVRSIARLAETSVAEPLPLQQAITMLIEISHQPIDWAQDALFDAFTANVFTHNIAEKTISLAVPAYGWLASSWRAS
jgi:hypothetical protein